ERIGVERARDLAASADVTVLVIDQAAIPEPPIVPLGANVLPVLNKSDLPSCWSAGAVTDLLGASVLRVSATTLIGLDALRQVVVERVAAAPRDGLPVLTRSRQRDALLKARDALMMALQGVADDAAPELVAVDVQAALDHIGSVTGV